jgi:phosphoglycolate phosphatase
VSHGETPVKLLFDLDGTLTDSGVGITRCIQHALAGLGKPVPPASELTWCVGPPLRDSFSQLFACDPDAPVVGQALALYRERFTQTGMFENSVYPGVREGLGRLRDAGHQLWVVTSKPHPYARRILDHFGLLHLFAAVYGAELSGEHSDKVSLLRHVVAEEAFEATPYMVGDRRHDVEGAQANGLGAVGVLWGYGSREELAAAGADPLFESMNELVEWAAPRARMARA